MPRRFDERGRIEHHQAETLAPLDNIHSRNVLSSETVASTSPAASAAAARIGAVWVPISSRNTGCGGDGCCGAAAPAASSASPASTRMRRPLVNARLSVGEIRIVTT